MPLYTYNVYLCIWSCVVSCLRPNVPTRIGISDILTLLGHLTGLVPLIRKLNVPVPQFLRLGLDLGWALYKLAALITMSVEGPYKKSKSNMIVHCLCMSA